MRFLLLNQTFYPDVAATAQHLSDLAVALVQRGHEVTVLTSRRAYDNPSLRFPAAENWQGVRILRVASSGFGKTAKWRRAADFATFLAHCCLRLVPLPRHDVVVALTSPPLISFLGAWYARLRGSRFVYWVMDLNPDESVAAGWLSPESATAQLLESFSRFSLRHADPVVVLDRFMSERVEAKGINPPVVLPPWSRENEVRFDPAGRERFRAAHGWQNKFVVMYAGNHSPCHPLDTLLSAAVRLGYEPNIVFCFLGGGSEFKKIRQLQSADTDSRRPQIVALPYQHPRELSGALSAADLHVVIMGDPFVGLVHPCKLYNILNIGAPVLYIGPDPSPMTEALQSLNGEYLWGRAAHGDVEKVVAEIRRARMHGEHRRHYPPPLSAKVFSKQNLLPRLVALLEDTNRSTAHP